MLSDPSRMHADLFGVYRLVRNIEDELVRTSRIVAIINVAEREITEIHIITQILASKGPLITRPKAMMH